MTDGCCVQCGAERVPLLRQRLPRQTAARRDLRGNRDHPPRQTGTPEQHLVALACDVAWKVMTSAGFFCRVKAG